MKKMVLVALVVMVAVAMAMAPASAAMRGFMPRWPGLRIIEPKTPSRVGLVYDQFTPGSGSTVVERPLGSEEEQDLIRPLFQGTLTFDVSADGRLVAYDRFQSGIWVYDRQTRRTERWTTGPADIQPALSPDGSQLAFNRGSQIMYVGRPRGFRTQQPQCLKQKPQEMQYSPDWGKKGIIFAGRVGRDSTISYFSPGATGSPTVLAQAYWSVFDAPRWSPDGDQFQFLFYPNSSDNTELYRKEASNDNPDDFGTLLQSRENINLACWMPDGNGYAFSTYSYEWVGKTLVTSSDVTVVDGDLSETFTTNWLIGGNLTAVPLFKR